MRVKSGIEQEDEDMEEERQRCEGKSWDVSCHSGSDSAFSVCSKLLSRDGWKWPSDVSRTGQMEHGACACHTAGGHGVHACIQAGVCHIGSGHDGSLTQGACPCHAAGRCGVQASVEEGVRDDVRDDDMPSRGILRSSQMTWVGSCHEDRRG